MMVRAMCARKFIDKSIAEKQMNMLEFNVDGLVESNGVSWYRHALRRDDDDSVLRLILHFEISGRKKRGRSRKTWKKQVKEQTEKIGL